MGEFLPRKCPRQLDPHTAGYRNIRVSNNSKSYSMTEDHPMPVPVCFSPLLTRSRTTSSHSRALFASSVVSHGSVRDNTLRLIIRQSVVIAKTYDLRPRARNIHRVYHLPVGKVGVPAENSNLQRQSCVMSARFLPRTTPAITVHQICSST